VRRCADVTLGDRLHIHLMDGTVPAAVTRKEAP
jgi:hypothetical protein